MSQRAIWQEQRQDIGPITGTGYGFCHPAWTPSRRDALPRDSSQATTGRSTTDDTPSACGSWLVASGQVLTGLAGCTTPVPTHPQTT